jgi:predicted unusual protein kinase regulating ubiquinone biosynthesis (AarF/ABC1/UbiB family)
MDTAIEADLNQLKVAASVYESFNNAIITTNIQQEISDRLKEELDYQKEAKHMEWYHHIFSPLSENEGKKQETDDFHIRLPQPLPHLSTKRLLTMTWLEGKPLLSATEWPQERRNQLARTFFKAWYKPFYQYGIIHGDPHLGNYTIQEKGILNLFDFGCVRKFSSSFIQGVIDLYYSLLNNDESLALKAYEQWGFKNITKELMDILNQWARFLYTPLLEDRIRPIDQTNNSVQGRLIAEEVHKKLQTIGGVSPPKEFVFMDRATVGVGSVMMHLKAELNWYQLFHELTQEFNSTLIDQRQQEFQY